ncbi:ABC transporter permease [Paraburkholderia fungorum]|jgi:putative spermidine/putrescine transport system permease protein|uniref:ABC transporter permease n=1 Tax=Paraburkholderia fungorum TaxID=134537 RepID=UPI000DB1193B|nr:ABC transporter permease [Paraburkholderia fungorum]PZR48936.1 MAG: ABC transporter permease [Paraburkholderia fungorum]
MSTHHQPDSFSGVGGKASAYLLATPATAIVALIVLVPALQLVRYSLNHFDPVELMQTALTGENYWKFFTDPYYLSVLWTTLKVSILCSVLALVFGFPVAYRLAKSQSRYKSLLIVLIVFPLLVGNVVRAAGWMVILGNAGFVNAVLLHLGFIQTPLRLMYTPLAVILGTTGVVLPYMILTLQSVLEGVDLSVEEAARNLGASAITSFFRIVLPIAVPGIAAGTMLVLILCMNAYATPVLLGGTGLVMMAPTVYDQISKANDWPFGSALAIILMIVTLGVAVVSNSFIQRKYAKTMQS